MESIIAWMIDNPEVGWIVTIAYLMWEIRGPKGAIHELKKSLDASIVVIRALAKTHNGVNEEMVDEYLVQNGNEPSDFIDEEVVKDENLDAPVPEDNHFDSTDD